MLQEVTNEGGTGMMANVEGFEVAGKTGTAQKADPAHGGYAAKKRVGSFVGFVPANDPRLVALVLIDEPEVNVYGGVVAAPVFRNIAQARAASSSRRAAEGRCRFRRCGSVGVAEPAPRLNKPGA